MIGMGERYTALPFGRVPDVCLTVLAVAGGGGGWAEGRVFMWLGAFALAK